MEKFSLSDRVVYKAVSSCIIKQALQAVNRGYEVYFVKCNGKFKLITIKVQRR